MRANATILVAATVFFAACYPAEMTPEPRQDVLARRKGTIVGHVRDARTNQPLEGVLVTAQYLGDETDAGGAFRIPDVDPGEVEVTVWRRDLIETRERVRVYPLGDATVDLAIERSPPPCCRLAGTWSVLLVLREPGLGPAAPETAVAGTVTFSPAAPDPFPEARQRVPSDDSTVDEFGVYDIDLRAILGDDITRAATNTVFEGRAGAHILTEAEGFVHHQNQVDITFIPRMSHGGISLTGTIAGDEIRGEWLKRDLAPSISGTFLMQRANH